MYKEVRVNGCASDDLLKSDISMLSSNNEPGTLRWLPGKMEVG
jgi:hypothetical protein